jgi:hypothetical protein
VAELADALDSGSSVRKDVEVRILSWALFFNYLPAGDFRGFSAGPVAGPVCKALSIFSRPFLSTIARTSLPDSRFRSSKAKAISLTAAHVGLLAINARVPHVVMCPRSVGNGYAPLNKVLETEGKSPRVFMHTFAN